MKEMSESKHAWQRVGQYARPSPPQLKLGCGLHGAGLFDVQLSSLQRASGS
jgi:hypothetical protein